MQQRPEPGEEASERTEVRVLYDERNLYVGMRMYDDDPSRIPFSQLRFSTEGAGELTWGSTSSATSRAGTSAPSVHRSGPGRWLVFHPPPKNTYAPTCISPVEGYGCSRRPLRRFVLPWLSILPFC